MSVKNDKIVIRLRASGLQLFAAVVAAVLSVSLAGRGLVALAAGADDVGSATDISASLPVVNDSTDNSTATRDVGEVGTCGAFPSAPSVVNTRSLWYRYTAASPGWLTVHTRGSNYDTVLEVYTSTLSSPAASDLISVACNDDIDSKTPIRQSQVVVPVTAGTTYYIAIRSYGTTQAVGTALFSARFETQQHLYVSSTGDDTNIGAADAPFRTIQRAVEVASANGDGVIHVLDSGPYGATTISKSLVLTATVAATASSFTLTNGAVLGSGTGGVTAPLVNVNQVGALGAKIQDGVLLAASGGTVNIGTGTYTETVTLNKSLTLQGSAGTVVTSPGGTAVQITAGTVTINDLTIQNSALGVSITGGGGHVLFHNNIVSNTNGVSNTSGSPATATSNYWGSSTGPAHSSNPGGAGNSATDNVIFTPWCTVAAPTCTPLAAIPTELVFTTQPSNSPAGVAFPTQPVLRAQDASGNLGINFNGAVTMTIGANPGGGSLSGTNPISGTNGVITFTNLSINAPGVGYTLLAWAALPGGITSTTSISFTIFNNTPVANDDNLSILEDSGVNGISGAVLANDTDDCPSPPAPPASNCLRFTAVTTPANGATAITTGGTGLTYTPNPDFYGTDVFTYTINDIYGSGTDTAVVTVTVTNINDPPAAIDDSFTVNEDSLNNPLDVLSNDTYLPDPAETLSIIAVGAAANGSVLFNSTVVTYTPNANFFGTDVFTYTISDGNGGLDTASIVVNVINVNDPLTAVDDTDTTNEDTPRVINVLTNDRAANIDGSTEPITVTAVGPPTSGTAAITGGGANVTYTPAPNFSGTAIFTYTVSDSAFSATATVTVTVNAVNDAPNVGDDTATTNEDTAVGVGVMANDNDVEGAMDAATLNIVSGPSNGTVITDATGVITYTPALNFNGTDVFQYSVCDTGTPLPALCGTAAVTITVTAVNDPVTAANDTASIFEDSGANPIAVLPNDNAANVDAGEVLTITAAGPAGNGVVITGTTVVTYTPSANFFGTDVFTYTVSDGGYTATATVTVSVVPVNDAPGFAFAGSALTVTEDAGAVTYLNWVPSASISPGAPNESGQTLTFTVTNTNNSLFSVQPALNLANGGLTFTPAPNAFGSATVFATLRDDGGTDNGGQDTSAPQSFVITITPVNDPPTANDDTASVLPDSGANAINVLANDSFAPDIGETLVITQVTQGINGTVAITGGGSGLTYMPNPGFTGTDTFTYTISDGNGGAATATVTVTVAIPNSTIYLPLVLKNVGLTADLIGSFSLSPANPAAGQPVMITAVITNQGTAAAGPFWVDFYINPSSPPTGPNVPWNVVSSYGIAWFVRDGLGPGQRLTLTSTPGGYCAPPTPGGSTPGAYCDANTIWPGAFAGGAKDLYLFVDSWNPTVATGAVLESDETNNRAEMHFPSPLAGTGDFNLRIMDARRPEDLPERPSP